MKTNPVLSFLTITMLTFLISCTLALSETEIKDTKGNVVEDTVEKQAQEVSPQLTVPVKAI